MTHFTASQARELILDIDYLHSQDSSDEFMPSSDDSDTSEQDSLPEIPEPVRNTDRGRRTVRTRGGGVRTRGGTRGGTRTTQNEHVSVPGRGRARGRVRCRGRGRARGRPRGQERRNVPQGENQDEIANQDTEPSQDSISDVSVMDITFHESEWQEPNLQMPDLPRFTARPGVLVDTTRLNTPVDFLNTLLMMTSQQLWWMRPTVSLINTYKSTQICQGTQVLKIGNL